MEELKDLYNSTHVLPIRIGYSHICQSPEGINITCNFTDDVPSPFLYLDTSNNVTYCKYAVIGVSLTIFIHATYRAKIILKKGY